jgi:hypothetical protein
MYVRISTFSEACPPLALFLLLFVDVVDWSVVLLLDNSVAESETEDGLASVVVEWLDVLWLVLSHLGSLLLGFLAWELSEHFGLLDLLVLQELVQGRLSDWDDLLDHVPEDTLGERRGGERSWVGPSSVEVEGLHELGQVKLLTDSIGKHGAEETIMVIINSVVGEEVIFDSTEEEAQDTVGELRLVGSVSADILWLKGMNDVHLKIEQFSINRMLRWGVEMCLESVQVSLLDVSVEKTNGGSDHYIILGLSLHDDLPLLTGLLVLSLLGGVDVSILDLEAVILVVIKALDGRVQIDWSSLLSE